MKNLARKTLFTSVKRVFLDAIFALQKIGFYIRGFLNKKTVSYTHLTLPTKLEV